MLLFQLLTGEYPFDAEDPRQIALLHLQAPAPRPSSRAPLSPALDAVVLRCLEKQAERRFANSTELLAALRAAIGVEQSGQQESMPALAVLVQLSTATDTELEDAMLEDMASVLDQVEQCLTNHGFRFPLHTATALLGVRLRERQADVAQEHAALQPVLAELCAALADRLNPEPAVQLALSLREGQVSCLSTASGHDVVGGELLDLGSWSAEHLFCV